MHDISSNSSTKSIGSTRVLLVCDCHDCLLNMVYNEENEYLIEWINKMRIRCFFKRTNKILDLIPTKIMYNILKSR
jgi:hypothetical protein